MSILSMDLTHPGSHKPTLGLSPFLQGILCRLALAVVSALALRAVANRQDSGMRRRALAELFSTRGMCGTALPAAFLHTEIARCVVNDPQGIAQSSLLVVLTPRSGTPCQAWYNSKHS